MTGEHGQGVPESAGRSIAAIGEQQAAASTRHLAAADADRALVQALTEAQAATVEAVGRLDEIEAEIDSAVANQGALGLDTALGAREFQKFLIAKQREIATVVSNVRELDSAKKAVLEALGEHYTGPAG